MSYKPTGYSTSGAAVVYDGKKFAFTSGREAINAFAAVHGSNPVRLNEFLELVHQKYPQLIQTRFSSGNDLKLTYGMVVAYLRILAKRWGSGAPLVSKEVAEQRAIICEGCEFNSTVPDCGACKNLAKLTLQTPRETFGRKIEGCRKCGCYLVSKIWIAKDVLEADFRKIQYPDHCWMNSLDD